MSSAYDKAVTLATKAAARSVAAVTGLPYATARQVVTDNRSDLIPHGTTPSDDHPVLSANGDDSTWADWIRLLIDAHMRLDATDLHRMAGAVWCLLAQSALPVDLAGAKVLCTLDGEWYRLDADRPGVLTADDGTTAGLPEWGTNPNPAKIVTAIARGFGTDADIRPYRPVDMRLSRPERGSHRAGEDEGAVVWHRSLLETTVRRSGDRELRVYDLSLDYGAAGRGLAGRFGDAPFGWEVTLDGVLLDHGSADTEADARAAADRWDATNPT